MISSMNPSAPSPNPKLADELISRLNLLLESSEDVRRDLYALMASRVPASAATANHETLQVSRGDAVDIQHATLSLLGLLNGLCGVIGPITREDGPVESVWDENGVIRSRKFDQWGFVTAVADNGRLLYFKRTGPVPKVAP
jgi:hypothetical protein